MKSETDIQEFIAKLSTEQRELRDDVTNILWHMRSLSRDEAWAMSWDERLDVKKLIEKRVAIVEKTGLPLI